MCAPVDEGGSLDVRGQERVDRVLLGQLPVHAHHGSLQNQVRVGQVGDRLMSAGRSRKRVNISIA